MFKPSVSREKSSLYGSELTTSATYHITSRIFYTLSFICTSLAFFFYVYLAYEKWKILPDIAIRKNQKFIGEIPFPAVTICSPVFSRVELVYYQNFSSDAMKVSQKEALENITPDEANYLISNMQACNPSYLYLTEQIYQHRTRSNVIKLMDESFLRTIEVFATCYYGAKMVKCSRMINRVLTDRGFCYSFNMQGFGKIFNADVINDDFHYYKTPLDDDNQTSEWNLEKGFVEGHQDDVVPIVAQKSVSIGFQLYVQKKNLENSCSKFKGSFNYFYHLPNEIPTTMHPKQFIQLNQKMLVTLTATAYKTSEELRKLKPEARGCYFEGERTLKFFKSYTKHNCDFECVTNYTLRKCGCVKFSMPRDKNTSVCDIDKIRCYYLATARWPIYNATTKQLEESCGCLRTCSDIKYSVNMAEITPIAVKDNRFLKMIGLKDE
jgi:amiloride-sensitive sodium channel